MKEMLGGCLCEKVQYKIFQPPLSKGVCYCQDCQKISGMYGNPLLVLQKDALELSQKTLADYKTTSARGSVVSRNFCKECGTHIFAQISDLPNILTIRASTLDDFTFFVPEYLAWIKSTERGFIPPVETPSFQENAPIQMILGMKFESSLGLKHFR